MATDFEKNALVLSGGLKPSSKNTPGDVRTRINTIKDMESIPLPYIGMMVYVVDEEKFYVIKSLKNKKLGPIEVTDSVVDKFEEFIVGATEDFVKQYVEEQLEEIELMPGPMGPEGPAGKDGEKGADGKDGVDGKDGINGIDGKDGKDFTYDMFTPEQLEALKGPKGDQGLQGEKGADGQNGVDGKDFTYDMFTQEQLEALKGADGKDGVNGIDGVNGKDFTYDMFTPEQLEALKGEKGADGVNGIDGKDFTYDMFTSEQLEALKGEQGIQGEKGDQGEKGEFDAETIFDVLNTENKTVLGAINELLNLIVGHHPGVPEGAMTYYGYIPYTVTGDIKSYTEITLDMIKHQDSVIVEEIPQVKDKTSVGVVPEACFIIIAVPAICEYTVTKDNGMGGKVAFEEDELGANNVSIIINDMVYKVFGELTLVSGERFIYIN